jgi:hypothetical protein
MECNVGGTDRYMRIGLGAVLLVVGVLALAGGTAGESMAMTVLTTLVIAVGAVFLVTGAVRFCPINSALGIDTCEASGGSGI